MATRVTDAEVREIIDTEVTDLTAFILAANGFVTDMLTGKGLSDDRLKEIERWLAAHFTAMKDFKNRVVEIEAGRGRERTGESVRGVLAQDLRLTRYGQQALVLDTTGTLLTVGKQFARFRVV
jgi:acyl CoA:acetate/3-ketoacid CoA transferase alpha subunit